MMENTTTVKTTIYRTNMPTFTDSLFNNIVFSPQSPFSHKWQVKKPWLFFKNRVNVQSLKGFKSLEIDFYCISSLGKYGKKINKNKSIKIFYCLSCCLEHKTLKMCWPNGILLHRITSGEFIYYLDTAILSDFPFIHQMSLIFYAKGF